MNRSIILLALCLFAVFGYAQKERDVKLDQVVVTAQIQEVTVKDDTVMFNAGAFKVPEGSMLEELVRKLPGIEVDENGTIKYNGKTVKKIMVGGKEFFGNSTQMAMKNIPTEIIDKIKAYDRQSDMSRITGIDDGEEETVLDIGIKKGMRKGWFGNVDASYGTRNRFSEKLNANRFKEGLQATLIGSFNNVNDQTGGGGGRGGNNGITTSAQAGLNVAADFKTVEVGGNVRYDYRNSDARTYNSSQNFVSTSASFSNSRNQNLNRNHGVNGDFKVEWKPDSMTTVLFRPSFSWGKSDGETNGRSATFNSDPYSRSIANPLDQMADIADSIKINENQSQSWSHSDNYNLNASLMVNRKLGGNPWFGEAGGKGGRNVSIRLQGAMSDSQSKNTNHSNVIYHQRGDSTDVTYRYRTTPNSNRSFSVGATYSEPILRNLFAQINYSYNYSKRHSDGKTYDFGEIDEVGSYLWQRYGQYGLMPDSADNYLSTRLSRYTDNINNTHNLEFSLRYVTSALNVSAGVRYEQQRQKMVYQYQNLDTTAVRDFARVSPTLNARYKFSKQHNIRLQYRGNTQQPNMTDLFNLTDNSNPLNIREGNPDLKPSFTNNLTLTYNNNIVDKKMNIAVRWAYSNTLNSISNRTEYNTQTGGQTTRPENINGNWNTNGNVTFGTPLGWEPLTINTTTSTSWNNHVGYIYQQKQTMTNTVKQLGLGERLTMRYRHRSQDSSLDFDVAMNGSVNYNRSRSDLVATSNMDTYNFNYGLSTNWSFDLDRMIDGESSRGAKRGALSFNTDLGMHSRRGYSAADMNTNELIWNAQISYRFLPKRLATVSLQAFDILQQRSNISRSITAYSRRDTETNAINSYVMLHFIYRLNIFGDKRAGRGERGERYGNDRESYRTNGAVGEGGRASGRGGGISTRNRR